MEPLSVPNTAILLRSFALLALILGEVVAYLFVAVLAMLRL
jgi:hypothetical protein